MRYLRPFWLRLKRKKASPTRIHHPACEQANSACAQADGLIETEKKGSLEIDRVAGDTLTGAEMADTIAGTAASTIKRWAYYFFSWFLVAWGQPARLPWLGLIASAVGFAFFWQGLITCSSKKGRFWVGFLWFTAICLVQLSWMTSDFYQGIYTWFFWAILSSIFGFQFALLSLSILPGIWSWSRILSVPALWTVFEWLRLFLFDGYTWNPVGLALTGGVVPRQWIAVGGIYFLSFWVIVTNVAVFQSIQRVKQKKRPFSMRTLLSMPLLALSLIAAPYLFGLAHLGFHLPRLEKSHPLHVALVQTGLEPGDKGSCGFSPTTWHPVHQWGQILHLLRAHEGKPLDLIVMPEGTVPFEAHAPLYFCSSTAEALKTSWAWTDLPPLPTLGSKGGWYFEEPDQKNHLASQGVAPQATTQVDRDRVSSSSTYQPAKEETPNKVPAKEKLVKEEPVKEGLMKKEASNKELAAERAINRAMISQERMDQEQEALTVSSQLDSFQPGSSQPDAFQSISSQHEGFLEDSCREGGNQESLNSSSGSLGYNSLAGSSLTTGRWSNADFCQLIADHFGAPLIAGLDDEDGQAHYNAALYFRPRTWSELPSRFELGLEELEPRLDAELDPRQELGLDPGLDPGSDFRLGSGLDLGRELRSGLGDEPKNESGGELGSNLASGPEGKRRSELGGEPGLNLKVDLGAKAGFPLELQSELGFEVQPEPSSSLSSELSSPLLNEPTTPAKPLSAAEALSLAESSLPSPTLPSSSMELVGSLSGGVHAEVDPKPGSRLEGRAASEIQEGAVELMALPPQRYVKQVLLPVVETLPGAWAKKIAQRYGIGAWYTRGEGPEIFASPVPIGATICYEETFGHIVRKNRQVGAQMLVNLTVDGWYPNSSLPLQHFAHGRLRAIENGIPLLRACHTGVTTAVDSLGRTIAMVGNADRSSEHLAEALYCSVPTYHYGTLYSLLGNGPVLGFSFAILGIVIWRRFQGVQRVGDRGGKGSRS